MPTHKGAKYHLTWKNRNSPLVGASGVWVTRIRTPGARLPLPSPRVAAVRVLLNECVFIPSDFNTQIKAQNITKVYIRIPKA